MKKDATFLQVINFEAEPLGAYALKQVSSAWNAVGIKGVAEGRCAIVKDVHGSHTKALRVLYPKGKVGLDEAGARWRMQFDRDHKELYVQYKVKFSKDFCFVRGGKLPGLAGGTAPTGGSKDTKGFSARIMWRTEKGSRKAYFCQYIYYPNKHPLKSWGEDFNWVSNRAKKYIVPGRWQTVKTRVKINTPNKRNGRVTSWLDGKRVLDVRLVLRAKGSKFGIDSFLFTTFFGGNDASWAPVKNEHIYFDDFIFSTKDIKQKK